MYYDDEAYRMGILESVDTSQLVAPPTAAPVTRTTPLSKKAKAAAAAAAAAAPAPADTGSKPAPWYENQYVIIGGVVLASLVAVSLLMGIVMPLFKTTASNPDDEADYEG